MKKSKPAVLKGVTKKNDEMYLLAVTSSAGGLEALTSLFKNLPPSDSLNICIVVAQHLSPRHKSHMVDLLAKDSKWPIKEASNHSKLEKGVIYISPPNRDISINERAIVLSKPSADVGPKPSGDLLFKSVAENYKEKAIALVLSGTNTDGSLGLKEIRKHGGLSLVQKPNTAAYEGMPNSALQSQIIDRIITPEEISEVLVLICSGARIRSNVQEKQVQKDLQGLEKVFDLLQKKSGVNFGHYKSIAFQRRLDGRIRQIHKNNIVDYLKYIEDNPKEIDELFNHVLIGVTHFFRDPLAFNELEKNLRQHISTKTKKTLRIWHPGCASGEEAYSTSILLHEIIGDDIQFWDIQIFATDIDNEAIAKGRRGEFPISSLSLMKDALVKKYFTENNDFVQVNKALRSIVLFSRHDLTNNPPFLKLDLITCRNLLIYFDLELQKRVISLFHYALEEDALLFLGNSENLGLKSDLFETISKTHKLWRRKIGVSKVAPRFNVIRTSAPLNLQPSRVSFDNKSIPERVEETLFSSFNKPYVVINDSLEIQYVSGDVKSFLQFNPGAMSSNILKQCKKESEIILGQTIQRAIATSESTYSSPRQLRNQDLFELFRFLVYPMLHFKETYYMVIYESMTVDYQSINTESVSNNDFESIRVSELQLELDTTRDHLKNYIEELEASNEEMQALNEELQSANEELQSVNEELETSNEELQISNEKLDIAYKSSLTAKELLEIKEQEMTKTTFRLERVLDSDLQGFIMCTDHFEILHYNEYAHHAISNLTGQKSNFKKTLLTYLPKEWLASFIELVESSITDGINIKQQFSLRLRNGEKRHLILSVDPVKNYLKEEEEKRIVIGILDNSEEFNLNEHLEETNKLLDQVSEVVNIGGWELDINSMLTKWTKGTYDIHKVEIDFRADLNTALKFYEDNDQLEINRLINRTIKTGKSFEGNFNFIDSLKNRKIVEIKGFPRFEKGEIKSVWGTIQDVTQNVEQKKSNDLLNAELTRSNTELEDFAYVASHDLQEPLRMIYSFIEILEDQYKERFDEEGKQYLGFITNGAKRMQVMLDDLLSYSRINSNDEPVEMVNLNALISDVLINFEAVIRDTKTIVTLGELEVIKGVPSLLSRLFQNLLSNSIKYNRGIPEISIWSEKKDNSISIFIKDNGIGIDTDQFEHIFGIFKRLHTLQEYPGSGIGLSVCKRIMIKHHGDIKVLASSKEGSVFHLEFITDEQ
jgi:two-component system CheB/CheR fusion protein